MQKPIGFSIIVFLLVWKLILFFILPYPNADGVWMLGHTFSILHGDLFRNTFAFSHVSFFNMPYMSGIILVPFYFFNIFGYGQIFVVNILFVVILLYQIKGYFARKGTSHNL